MPADPLPSQLVHGPYDVARRASQPLPPTTTFTGVNGPSSALGRRAQQVFEVLDLDTAVALGSGSVPVLSTPRLLAWMEAVTVAALDPAVAVHDVSVGIHVHLDHLRPSAVGAKVSVEAVVSAVDGPRVDCDVEARDGEGALVGRGRITRMVVDQQRFLDRMGSNPTECGDTDSVR